MLARRFPYARRRYYASRRIDSAALARQEEVELVARIFRVPYWLLGDYPRPSWLRRPRWRYRELRWRRS